MATARVMAAASFLRNNRKQERHYAFSLYIYHVHHIRNEVALLPLVEMGTAPPIVPGYDMLLPIIRFSH